MSTVMRAKFKVISVVNHSDTSQFLQMAAVAANSYPEDGSDEDNTYAKFSPSANLGITINNPALIGQFEVNQKFYVDFTPVDNLATGN